MPRARETSGLVFTFSAVVAAAFCLGGCDCTFPSKLLLPLGPVKSGQECVLLSRRSATLCH